MEDLRKRMMEIMEKSIDSKSEMYRKIGVSYPTMYRFLSGTDVEKRTYNKILRYVENKENNGITD